MNPIKLLFIVLVSLSITSCSKELTDGAQQGTTDFVLTINGTDLTQNKASQSKTSTPTEQTIVTHLNENTSVIATLIQLQNNSEIEDITKKSSTTTNKETITRELAENTKIKILIYDSNGDKFKEIDHIYKKNGREILVENLLRGESYTFIAYSINSPESIPSASDNSTISDLKIEGLTSEFLYFKQSLKIEKDSENSLNIKLKHQFSSVYMSLAIDQTDDLQGSRITQITAPTISPAFTSAGFNLNTGTRTFGAKIPLGKTLPIDNAQLNNTTIISNNSLVLADGTPSTFNINSLTINGYTQSINLTGFNIQPGTRYHLKLAIACPCTTDVTPTRDISLSSTQGALGTDLVADTVNYSNADFGAVLDIYKIDNSLNLKVNDTPIYRGSAFITENPINNFSYPVNEIQFQGYGHWRDVNSPPNVEYEDGTRWGFAGIPIADNEIWKFDGSTNKNPVIRIIIDKTGNIDMFASKNTAGGPPFYPIKVINNQIVRNSELNNNYTVKANTYKSYSIQGSFQKVPWKNGRNDINTIALSQRISGATSFQGRITGKKVIPCPVR